MSDPAQSLVEARIQIATLEAEVSHLSQGLVDLQESNRMLNEKVDKVLLTLSEAQGGWRTLMAVGGAAGSLGAFGAWIAQHWK